MKHPGTGATNLTSVHDDGELTTSGQVDGPSESSSKFARFAAKGKDAASTGFALEQLANKGFIPLKWHGKCEADKVSIGTYDVAKGQGGMFGLVFDNTFSKQTSKTATFVLLTYPTGAPPQTAVGRHLPNLQAGPVASSSRTSLPRNSPRLGPFHTDSQDSLHSHVGGARAMSIAGRSVDGAASGVTTPSTYHAGNLLKRRRKKGQGYARRFFSLDYTSCTLSYYYSRNSSALRGAIPLSLAAVAADERRREISIDSGAEIWHLKAANAREFNEWARALERASRIIRGLEKAPEPPAGLALQLHESLNIDNSGPERATGGSGGGAAGGQADDDLEWQQVEALVSRIVGTRDALRRLVKDMAAQKSAMPPPPLQMPSQKPPTSHPSSSSSATAFGGGESGEGYVAPPPEKRPFWKRKPSASPLAQHMPFQQSSGGSSSQLTVPSPASGPTKVPNGGNWAAAAAAAAAASAATAGAQMKRGTGPSSQEEHTMHDHLSALLNDLDSVALGFSTLLSNQKRRRQLAGAAAGGAGSREVPQPGASRRSIDSTTTNDNDDEFFDAEAGFEASQQSQVVLIGHASEEDDEEAAVTPSDVESVHSSSSVSSTSSVAPETADSSSSLFPPKPKSLVPLPLTGPVQRRTTIPAPTTAPPSLIAFVRKNVGKDLSTISMPVSANEPTSLLQRIAEQLEYASLLSRAATTKQAVDRLLLVAAFAVSHYSGGRVRERAARKPFNPLLGETFELLRTDDEVPGGGFRLLVEKVSHRPVMRLACQAESALWTYSHSPAPTQKFWGKSAELTTEGRVRVALRLPAQAGTAAADGSSATQDEYYSWPVATVFLRNVVMGEKYVEPVGSVTVVNETTGARATIEFRSRGMFGGRGEDVQVEAYGPDGDHLGVSLAGTWTQGLRRVDAGRGAGEEVWRVGPLVDDAPRRYGLTRFAATLNELGPLEKGKLPPTDTRLRPDQRLLEEGRLDEAESEKVRLEEAQRARRRRMEEQGVEHVPRWFVRVSGSGSGGAGGTEAGGDEVWRLKTGKDGYWEERSRGAWTGVEDIFGHDEA